jgi:hypothetical protein
VSRPRAALAGAAAALVWGALEPLDKRVFRNDYSDIAVLGKFVTRSRAWSVVGTALHVANGAAFGLAFDEIRRRTSFPARRLALSLALAEHLALYPLSYFVDRNHPARGEPGVRSLLSPRGFAQATVRHALFGALLGRISTER